MNDLMIVDLATYPTIEKGVETVIRANLRTNEDPNLPLFVLSPADMEIAARKCRSFAAIRVRVDGSDADYFAPFRWADG